MNDKVKKSTGLMYGWKTYLARTFAKENEISLTEKIKWRILIKFSVFFIFIFFEAFRCFAFNSKKMNYVREL